MEEFIVMFVNYISGLFNVLSNISFRFFDYRIDLLGVFVGFSALAIICSLFWRGGRQ